MDRIQITALEVMGLSRVLNKLTESDMPATLRNHDSVILTREVDGTLNVSTPLTHGDLKNFRAFCIYADGSNRRLS